MPKISILILLASVLASLSNIALSVPAQIPLGTEDAYDPEPIITPAIRKHVEYVMEQAGLHGVSLGIVKDGRVEIEGFGVRNEDNDPVTPDTRFQIGDCSMGFASMALVTLIHEYGWHLNSTPLPDGVEELSWNTKVKSLIPEEWVIQDEYASEKATLSDLLSHSVGLTGHELSLKAGQSPSERVKQLRKLRMFSELRQKWYYSRSMYIVLKVIIDKLTGNFTEYVESRLFRPARMTSTGYSYRDAEASGNLTQTWSFLPDLLNWPSGGSFRRVPAGFGLDSEELMAAPSGVISSARDMIRWLDLLLNQGVDRETNESIIYWYSVIIAKLPWAAMGLYSIPSQLSEFVYSTGWIRDSYKGHQRIWHDSSGGHYFPGSTALTTLFPMDKVGIFIGVNTDQSMFAEGLLYLSYGIYDAIFNLEAAPKAIDTFHPKPTFPQLGPWTQKLDAEEIMKRYLCDQSLNPWTNEDYFVGKYVNEAYGTVVVCTDDNDDYPEYCGKMRNDFESVGLNAISWAAGALPTFYGHYFLPILLPFAGREVLLMGLEIYPNGYGKNTTPFYTSAVVATANVMPGLGFGLYDLGADNPGDSSDPAVVKAKSSAWFDWQPFD